MYSPQNPRVGLAFKGAIDGWSDFQPGPVTVFQRGGSAGLLAAGSAIVLSGPIGVPTIQVQEPHQQATGQPTEAVEAISVIFTLVLIALLSRIRRARSAHRHMMRLLARAKRRKHATGVPPPRHSFAWLRSLSDENLVNELDGVAQNVGHVSLDFYLREMARRETDRQTSTMVCLTWVITFLTVVNVAAVIVGLN